jgi:2-keto-4-pentenoate hydratase/2-oxohepta-3-ene-1,7-dioic acid hydratase in catechol pathway
VSLPVAVPSKIVCAGRNYRAHAAELGNDVPDEPLVFLKPPSTLIGEGETILLPQGVGRVDYEGEIAVVVGRRARNLREEDVADHLSGILPLNDVTAREYQRTDSQWLRAKGFDTFCPVGTPVPLDGIDLGGIDVVTRVNGEERQRGSSRQMVFSIPFLVSWISRIMTLEPGDIVTTGSPKGVGPLEAGDEVEVEVVGVGSVRNPVRMAPGV